MAKNKAAVVPAGAEFMVRVNDQNVYQLKDKKRAEKMAERLNRIFQDGDRDLDFLTPSVMGKDDKLYYGIICPTVRKNKGRTHFHNPKRKAVDRNMYPPVDWVDSPEPDKQTVVFEFESTDTNVPWVTALVVTNRIRRAIELHFPDASGRRKHPLRCYLLYIPHNQTDAIETVIADKAYCAVYAHPCQGRSGGTHSPKCEELGYRPENISNPFTAYFEDEDEFEILHGCDLTCAITRSNGWYTKYKNHFLRVTNLKNNRSVVVRVTDEAPRGRGVELTYWAWQAIGKPTDRNAVRIELLKS
ncbi:hypothetical protein CBW65_07980 [Tumebacillus avium]|uniref:Uncharacterized protein n=1 Tax=Tumebacillus avium TaxID=1903704 RepID=A0A1Y0IMH8_9BACL|nr:hypothetical protein [Tumebacillus avium]ARU61026.1 hypothetical protein CBW65_07980 [Tumebacillus avium]